MKPRKTREIDANLQKKGFKSVDRNHKFYILYVKGKKTSIFTKISHGLKEYPPSLLGQMAKQIRLDSDEFEALIDCPLTHNKLVDILTKKGALKCS